MLTKESVSTFHKEFDTVVAALAAKHGLSFVPGRFTYDPENGMIKSPVVFGEKDTIGGLNPIYVQDLSKFGFLFGFTKDDINTLTFQVNGDTFTVQGMKGKNKIAAQSQKDKKTYLFDAVKVQLRCGRTASF